MAFFNGNNQYINITAIGRDGTATNTGLNNGVIPFLVFHANELHLCHLFCFLDGKTKGLNEFDGKTREQQKKCYEAPIIKFSPIENNIPLLEITDDLSMDQK